jgi:hypothetical protein
MKGIFRIMRAPLTVIAASPNKSWSIACHLGVFDVPDLVSLKIKPAEWVIYIKLTRQ